MNSKRRSKKATSRRRGSSTIFSNVSPETSPPETEKFRTDPDDVHLYTSPWVSGTRAENYFGAINAQVFYEKNSELEQAIIDAFNGIQRQCARLGGNSIVGVEMTIDPFATPSYVNIVGTGAKLVPLFDP